MNIKVQFQMPEGVEIPIKHDLPKTTLESLTQIKNEFDTKLQEANAKNDSAKKRRYQRQIKVNLHKNLKINYSKINPFFNSNLKTQLKPQKKENHLITLN